MGKFSLRKIDKNLNPLKPAFSDEELVALTKNGTIIDIAPGTTIFEEGKPGDELAIIIAGQAKITRRGKLITALESGTVIGEAAVLTGKARDASVSSVSMCKIVVLKADGFASSLTESLDFRLRVDGLVQQRAA